VAFAQLGRTNMMEVRDKPPFRSIDHLTVVFVTANHDTTTKIQLLLTCLRPIAVSLDLLSPKGYCPKSNACYSIVLLFLRVALRVNISRLLTSEGWIPKRLRWHAHPGRPGSFDRQRENQRRERLQQKVSFLFSITLPTREALIPFFPIVLFTCFLAKP
jgi:hypothetical protein